MYGTIARLTVQEGKIDQLIEAMAEYDTVNIPGMVSTHVYRAVDDPNECWVAVVFDSRESYVANAETPEQHARYQKMRALLKDEPEWHDGELVYSHASR